MPQPDGEIQIPRTVVRDPAPGNDAPEPPAGTTSSSIDGRRKTSGKRLSRVYSYYSHGFFYSVFSFSFLGGLYSFHVPLLVISCSSLVCDVFVILHVAGLCNVIMYRRLSLGGVRGLFAGFVQYVLWGSLLLLPS